MKLSDKDSFAYLWNNFILPTAFSCVEQATIKKLNFCVDTSKEKFEEIYAECHKEKIFYKDNFYNKNKKKEGYLSYQKLAAIVCDVLTKRKLIKFDFDIKKLNSLSSFDRNDLINSYLINYKFALHAGFSILYFSLLSDYSDKCFKKELKTILKFHSICSVGGQNEDTLEEIVIKSLAINDINGYENDLKFLTVIMRLYKEFTKEKILH